MNVYNTEESAAAERQMGRDCKRRNTTSSFTPGKRERLAQGMPDKKQEVAEQVNVQAVLQRHNIGRFELILIATRVAKLEQIRPHDALKKLLEIEDLASSDIVNSTPGSPVVITADTARGIDFRGAFFSILSSCHFRQPINSLSLRWASMTSTFPTWQRNQN